MKIGIIDADLLDNGTRHPNLALMKISGYNKELGYIVELLTSYEVIPLYDKVYISKVFTFTRIPEWVVQTSNVIIGGTGFFPEGDEFLPSDIEHHMPDYSLYDTFINLQKEAGKSRLRFADYIDYSIGFATRGCFRKCEFCVNKKYDDVFKHSPITEFLDVTRPYIYLWDDNFLAYSGWEDILDEIEATSKPFQFRQGLDIRLMTDKMATRLAKTKYRGDFIFAFDHIEERNIIESKLKLWKRHCAKTTKFYVLCAFDSNDEVDIVRTFERIQILMKYGCIPYIMRYESYKQSEFKSLYTQLARWCNQPQFFKKKSFRQFCEANQDYHKNKETTCSAYQSMIDFESNYPATAKRYFDLRFDIENEYSISYGYERKYAHKQDCEDCKLEQKTWLDAYHNKIKVKNIIFHYFNKEIDLQCLTYRTIKCSEVPQENIASWFCNVLINTSIAEIIGILKHIEIKDSIQPSNIPQFSNIKEAIHTVIRKIYDSGLVSMTYDDLGFHLDGKFKNKIAQKKYGENHSKFAALLDLTVITSPKNSNQIELSVLGKAYYKLDEKTREKLAARLALRIPIVQALLKDASYEQVFITDYMYGLSDETKKRRKPNIINLLNFIKQYAADDLISVFNNIG